MDLLPCPSCGLPRAAADAASPCPVCGERPAEPPPAVEPEPVALTPAGPPAEEGTARNWVLLGGTVAVGAAVVAGLLLVPTRDHPTDVPSPVPEVAIRSPAQLRPPAPPVGPEVAPPPREPSPALPVVASAEPTPEPVGKPVEVIAVDRPGTVYRLPRLADGKRVRLVGEGLTGGADLDTTGLAVGDVAFAGAVDGGATAAVRTAGGVVLFNDPVAGRARVTVDAGAGFVGFTRPVAGGARVTVAARSAYFGGVIRDAGTRVEVTLGPKGAPKFAVVDAAAQLLYKTGDPAGPPPAVTRGEVRGRAEVQRTD